MSEKTVPVVHKGEGLGTVKITNNRGHLIYEFIDPFLNPSKVLQPATRFNPESKSSRKDLKKDLMRVFCELTDAEADEIVNKVCIEASELKAESRDDSRPVISTTYLELDNEIVEQISGGRFLKWTPGEKLWAIIGHVETEDAIYIPANSEEEAEGAILLPDEPEEYGTVEGLVEEIQDFIKRYVDVSDTFRTISAWYILLTWVYERVNTLPYLRVLGDWGTGKSRFLDTVGGLCYRATITAGAVTPAPIYRLLKKWRGTIILEEADRRKSDETDEVITILNCGFEKRRPVLRCTKDDPDELQVLPTFSPKIFATRRRFQDVALESRCLTEVMQETDRDDIPVQLPSRFYEEQRKLRNKLLMFRIRNWHRVDPDAGIDLDLGDVEPRLKQATISFAVLFKNIDGAYEKFKSYLKKLQREIIEERANTVEGMVVNALFALTHVTDVTNVTNVTRHRIGNKEYIKLSPKEIAEYLIDEGILKDIKPQRVGQILKTLGLRTEPVRIDGEMGRYLMYDEKVLKSLARRYLLKQIENEDVQRKITDVTSVTAVTTVTRDSADASSAHKLNLSILNYVKENNGKVTRAHVLTEMAPKGYDADTVTLAIDILLNAGYLIEDPTTKMLRVGRR